MIFDTSSIYRAIRENKSSPLRGHYSVILARYELGNVLWKEVMLKKTYSRHEGELLIACVEKVLAGMFLLHPESTLVFKTAVHSGLTYYDASYVYAAQSLGLPLVTEDNKIKEKAGKLIKVQTLSEIL